jgi:putative FmdB family regulatory protein
MIITQKKLILHFTGEFQSGIFPMPIYEYQAVDSSRSCPECRNTFEVFQGMNDKRLSNCPVCGKKVRKIISRCHAAVVETSDEDGRVKKKITQYEKSGMWSHAAELADKHSEKTKEAGLKTRALEDYKKAGYDADSLAKYAKTNND